LGIFRELEARFYGTLNRFVEPWGVAGFGSPSLLIPAGLVVVETIGRKSGQTYNVPLLASVVGDAILVSTMRSGRSNWARNLAANPDVRIWLGGKARPAKAFVFAPDGPRPDVNDLPFISGCVISGLLPLTDVFGLTFAVLVPE
jgi:deazaflavin-dependent oxidoreductase (nitroreductase family)